MTTKANKQSKLMQYITTPFRIIGMTRDFYTKTMFDCAGRIGEGSVVACHTAQVSHIPTKFDVYLSNVKKEDDHVRELLRAVPNKRELDGRIMESNVPQGQPAGMGCGRSYSVGVGRIGRIDEDKSCDFEEDELVVKGKEDLFHTRSRSYAVTKRNPVYY
ncbi:uncharacterized protein LOC132295794 [Cornus florida]|uniref:uncharacterized protein LOC132295794 n=1 Tax=Cornus florida TaxID=4283 RepID=UPI00289B2D3B|nr:uncharacterized protein LOC132295794 [Cornus florida]